MGDHQADEVAQLLDIQRRTRELLRRHPSLRAEFAAAFDRCVEQHCASTQRQPARLRKRALERIRNGELGLVAGEPLEDWELVRFRALCEKPLDQAIRTAEAAVRTSHARAGTETGSGLGASPWPESLRERYAAALEAALEWVIRYQALATTDEQGEDMAAQYRRQLKDGGFVERRWQVWVPKAEDEKRWCHLSEVDPGKLRRLSDEELLDRAMLHLGGLADFRAIRPTVPEPELIDGDVLSYSKQIWHEQRLPVQQPDEDGAGGGLDPAKLPPDLGGQLLHLVENWVREHLADQSSSEAPRLERGVLAIEPGDRRRWPTEEPKGLNGSHVDVLEALAQTRSLRVPLAKVLARVSIKSEKTLSKYLHELKDLGYVSPPGDNAVGWQITEGGLAALKEAKSQLATETLSKSKRTEDD